jgi:hypothetical protein
VQHPVPALKLCTCTHLVPTAAAAPVLSASGHADETKNTQHLHTGKHASSRLAVLLEEVPV